MHFTMGYNSLSVTVTLKKNLLGCKNDTVISDSIRATGDQRFKTLDCCSLPMQSLANLKTT